MAGDMGKRRMKKKKRFSSTVVKLIISVFVILFAYIIVSMITAAIINKQVKEKIRLSSDYFVSELDRNLGNINDYLGNLVIGNADVNLVRFTDDRLKFIQASQRVNDKLEFYRSNLNNGYRFFVYYTDLDYYNASERGTMGIQELKGLNWKIKDFISADYAEKGEKTRKKWKIQKVDGEWIAYNYFYYDGIYACSFIEAEELVKSANIVLLGEESYAVLLDSLGNPYNEIDKKTANGQDKRDGYHPFLDAGFGMSGMVLQHQLEYADFKINLIVENDRNVFRSMLLQYFIFLLLLAGILVTVSVLYKMKKKILNPMKYFSDNLERLQQNPDNYYCEANEIVELQEANLLFAKVFAQVKELKIKMYEQTLEKQKMQMEYMQLQIKPHFYINCLNMIYNMACIGDYEAIQKMASFISNYFRYIFKLGSEYAALDEELKHSKTYLDICMMRYEGRIEYEICEEPEHIQIMIPPLLIKTFVENAVKYAMQQGKTLHIKISAEIKEEDLKQVVCIIVEDNGRGFPEQVLENLKKEKAIITEQGERIGIMNCIKRIRVIYGMQAKIAFTNKETGGAIVSICIPMER